MEIVDVPVPCPYHEQGLEGCTAEPQLDGDWKYYEGECGSTFGFTRIAAPDPGEGTCQLGLQPAALVHLGATIGRRPE